MHVRIRRPDNTIAVPIEESDMPLKSSLISLPLLDSVDPIVAFCTHIVGLRCNDAVLVGTQCFTRRMAGTGAYVCVGGLR